MAGVPSELIRKHFKKGGKKVIHTASSKGAKPKSFAQASRIAAQRVHEKVMHEEMKFNAAKRKRKKKTRKK